MISNCKIWNTKLAFEFYNLNFKMTSKFKSYMVFHVVEFRIQVDYEFYNLKVIFNPENHF